MLLVSRTRNIYNSTVVYIIYLSISSMCSCETHRQEGACGSLLSGRCAVAHARRRYPASFSQVYGRSTRMTSWLIYLSSLVPATSIYLSASSAVSSPLSVCCCVSYVAMIHSQSRVASDSTKHTLERESPVVVTMKVHPYSCNFWYLRCVTSYSFKRLQ